MLLLFYLVINLQSLKLCVARVVCADNTGTNAQILCTSTAIKETISYGWIQYIFVGCKGMIRVG